MVGIEAMACESFVIARAGGGSKEYMQDGINCKLFEFDNFAKDARQYILNLENNYRDIILHNARNMCVEQFSWESIASETELLYDNIMKDCHA